MSKISDLQISAANDRRDEDRHFEAGNPVMEPRSRLDNTEVRDIDFPDDDEFNLGVDLDINELGGMIDRYRDINGLDTIHDLLVVTRRELERHGRF